jgi:hypothetical protein
MINETAIRARYEAIKDQLDERGRRLFVAAEKIAAGYGGTAAVSRATGVAHSTIIRGAKDLLTVPDVTEPLLFPPLPDVPSDQRPVPDWSTVHRDLRRANVTLTLLWGNTARRRPRSAIKQQWLSEIR